LRLRPPDNTHTRVRGSFLIRSRTPWSPKDRDKKVDSDIPGKFFAANTGNIQFLGLVSLTISSSPVKGSETIDLMWKTSALKQSVELAERGPRGITYLRISKRLKRRRYSPSTFTERSPKTKKPPSGARDERMIYGPCGEDQPLLSTSFSLCREETKVPASAVCGATCVGWS